MADTLVQKLRAEVAWLWFIITQHWATHHPDQPLPSKAKEGGDDGAEG